MKLSHMLRATAATVALLAASATVQAASSVDDLVPKNAPASLSGAYLAGRSADAELDFSSAVPYYAKAFQADTTDATIGERLVTLAVAAGKIDDAIKYAQQLIVADPSNPTALITLGAHAFDQGQFAQVATIMAPVTSSALGQLTSGLVTAWAIYGQSDVDKAVQTVDALNGPSWYGIFKDYNRALILDAAGRQADAAKSIASAYQTDATALDVVLAYATIEARNGQKALAVKALTDFLPSSPVQAPITSLLQKIQQGQMLGPVVSSARNGAAKVLYGLGVAIGTDQGPELPALYLRLALVLDPASDITILSLGDVFQTTNRCQDAVTIYQSMAMASPLHRNADLQTSNCLVNLNQAADAVTYAKRVVDANPKDVDAIIQLGNAYRANNQFAEAAAAYSRGIDANPASVDWRILYYRGVSYTMANDWPKAEADFEKALMVNPGQPQVLNYLGYSWVDRGEHLDEAVSMIKMAADQRPDDGYIIDSLGWAYYQLGRYTDAVSELERAVALSPQESTLNDHLGDAYWKVGRKLDAVFQWNHARDYNPDPGDLPKIEAKLQHGLDTATPTPPPAPPAGSVATANGSTPGPTSFTVQQGDTLSSIATRVYGDPGQSQRIYDANRGVIKDPNALTPGTVLVIPGAAAH